MIKLLLTLLMMFTFGTSTVSAEENTTSTEDRISELAEIKPNSELAIKAKVDELSEAELKAIIENVDELTEPTETDLVIKETATNKLKEIEGTEEFSPLTIGLSVLVFVLMFASFAPFIKENEYD